MSTKRGKQVTSIGLVAQCDVARASHVEPRNSSIELRRSGASAPRLVTVSVILPRRRLAGSMELEWQLRRRGSSARR